MLIKITSLQTGKTLYQLEMANAPMDQFIEMIDKWDMMNKVKTLFEMHKTNPQQTLTLTCNTNSLVWPA